MKTNIFLSLFFLVTTVLVFETPYFDMFGTSKNLSIDVAVQDCFFKDGKWRLSEEDNPVLHFVFYDGIKILLVALAVGSAVLGAYYFKVKKKEKAWKYIFFTLTISSIKAITHVYKPARTVRYGGDIPYVKALEAYPETFLANGKKLSGRGFPAGHASGGFALIALAFLATTQRLKIIGWAIAIGVGSSMGMYQVIRGEHFLSHNFFTFAIAWLIAAIVYALSQKIWRDQLQS